MLAYFADHLIHKYDWFIRIDDDTVLQWDNLNEFLVNIDHRENYMIGSPGFGRDNEDYIEDNMVYCMGGTGIIFSNQMIRSIRPHLHNCIKSLYTEHEDIEVSRCIWRYTDTTCTRAHDNGKYFFQNWAKKVKTGGIGYKPNIDPVGDLTNYIIDSAIVMHAVKVSTIVSFKVKGYIGSDTNEFVQRPSLQLEIRKRILSQRAKNLQVQIQELQRHVKLVLGQNSIKTKISTKQLIATLRNCSWDGFTSHSTRGPKRSLHFGTSRFPVKKLSTPMISEQKATKLQSAKIFSRINKYYYGCNNERGFSLLEYGKYRKSASTVKVNGHEGPSGTRQYLTTHLFEKEKIYNLLRVSCRHRFDHILFLSSECEKIRKFDSRWRQPK